MGTTVTLDLFGGDAPAHAELTARLEEAVEVLRAADDVFSTWVSWSPLSRLRRGELDLDEAPEVVREVLTKCDVARLLTRGWFNPWSMPGGVDPTGLVKGWAAQRALDILRSLDVRGALVNAAGDVASFGGLAEDEPFRIGVVRPDDPRRLACVVTCHGAVATSGSYERGPHLINPFTGRPAAAASSATVTGPNLGLADAFATALAVAGPEGLDFIESLEDYEGLVIDDAGDYHATRDFPLTERFPRH